MAAETGKAVLVLGAGMCCPPLVKYLDKQGYKVLVGSRTKAKAEAICGSCTKAEAHAIDVETDAGLAEVERLVPSVDAVVSMLPYLCHPKVARITIKHKKHFLTTSYVTPEMREIGELAKEAGVILVSECGVDPGTDHMSAMRVILGAQAKGGKIKSFKSYCGGLPAPAFNDNPFGYKFSWAPRGVLLAARNQAFYLEDGEEKAVPNERLWKDIHELIVPGLSDGFEAVANRNSLPYVQTYGLEGVSSMSRWTLRNKGWSGCIAAMIDINLLDIEERDFSGVTAAGVMGQCLAKDGPATPEEVAAKVGCPVDSSPIDMMKWLGLFSDTPIPAGVKTRLDVVSNLMGERLLYKDGEKDLIVMCHKFIIEYPERGEREHVSSVMTFIGAEETAMSITVATPVAIATHMVLNGQNKRTGLVVPVEPDVFNPILDALAPLGVVFKETVDKVEKM